MARELNEENLREAYCKVLACTRIGAAESKDGCEGLMDKKVLVVVPAAEHDDYPAKLLACAIRVCANDPYNWIVEETEPTIDSETTFEILFNVWFVVIISA